MDEYKHLKYAIDHFSADWEYTDEEYEESFQSFVNREPDYAEKIKIELREALLNPNWSWVKIAYDTNFIGSDDTEENVWLSVKSLIWNVVSLNDELPENAIYSI